ncbi:MAG: response regulator [bacterium]|nr:response regulator [bacterium]
MKILIVEDSVETAEILAEAARLFGCEQVDVVASGGDAIGKAILVDYDLITLDIRMPGVSGLDALSVIRGIRAHSILAIISGYLEGFEAEAFQQADVVLSKPVPLDLLQQVFQLSKEIRAHRRALRDLGNF